MLAGAYHEWMNELLQNARSKKYDYIISRGKNNQKYFYYDFDEYDGTTPNLIQLIWTPHPLRAFLFHTEQDVEEFKSDFISPRKASIIRVAKAPSQMLELLG